MMKRMSLVLFCALFFGTPLQHAQAQDARVYAMSFDQTYQMTLDALQEVRNWQVLETDQLAGLITIETGGFFMPRRSARISVQRLDPYLTKVEFYQGKAPWFSGKFFKAIDKRVQSRTLAYPR